MKEDKSRQAHLNYEGRQTGRLEGTQTKTGTLELQMQTNIHLNRSGRQTDTLADRQTDRQADRH